MFEVKKKTQQQQSSCIIKRNIPTITGSCGCIQPLKHDINTSVPI